jgi:hypothetical protein
MSVDIYGTFELEVPLPLVRQPDEDYGDDPYWACIEYEVQAVAIQGSPRTWDDPGEPDYWDGPVTIYRLHNGRNAGGPDIAEEHLPGGKVGANELDRALEYALEGLDTSDFDDDWRY